MAKGLPSEAVAAQQPSYVTYTFTTASVPVPHITLLEKHSVISVSGTTGAGTWEAAIHLGRYLVSDAGADLIRGKRVLELGAGTGLLSILCARWLGSAHVTATDGDDGVVEALESNIFLNGLQQSGRIDARSLKWGWALEDDEGGNQREVDVVIAADVTYDPSSVPPLISTLREFSQLNTKVDILIAAMIRSEDTFSKFLQACERNHLMITDIEFPMYPTEEQTGPFYSTRARIRIIRLHPTSQITDPFAI